MRKSKGFTLVEMLIVIAVIGVLAVAVLSAINPVEQMRKARDTRRKSNAAELLNAIERYYATHEEHSASLTGHDQTTCALIVGDGAVNQLSLTQFVSEDELKSEFIDRVTDDDGTNNLYVGIDSTTDLAYVCFEIESAANISKAGTDACSVGGLSYTCIPE